MARFIELMFQFIDRFKYLQHLYEKRIRFAGH